MKAPDFAGSPWVTFASWREDSNDGQPFTMTVLEEGQPGPQAKYVKIGNPPKLVVSQFCLKRATLNRNTTKNMVLLLPYNRYPQQKHKTHLKSLVILTSAGVR